MPVGRMSRFIFGSLLSTVVATGTLVVGLAGVAGAATGTVAISGTLEIPNTLTATVTPGVGPYTYQWYDCTSASSTPTSGCTTSGATSASTSSTTATYVLGSSDYNQYITVLITDSGNSTSFYATPVGPITDPVPTASGETLAITPSSPVAGTAELAIKPKSYSLTSSFRMSSAAFASMVRIWASRSRMRRSLPIHSR